MASERKFIVGTRLTDQERGKLDALADFLGITKTECIAMLIENEYDRNRKAIEAMLTSRAAIKGKR